MGRIWRRIKQIISFALQGAGLADSLKLAVAGFARGHGIGGSVMVRARRLPARRIELDLSDLGQLISFEEIFVEGGYDLRLVPFTPAMILDCGAHAGFFSLLAGDRFPAARLVAFEPNPRNVSAILNNMELSGLSIELIKSAASIDDGEVWFEAKQSNTGAMLAAGEKTDAAVRVRTVDLPRWFRKRPPASLLLKMDVEGEEKRLLPALLPLLPPACAAFFETHGGPAQWNEAASMFGARGFDVRQLRCRGEFADGFAVRTAGEP